MFPTDYASVIARIEALDVVKYGSTRNYLNGVVSRLSPYISRGLISLPMIKDIVLQRFTVSQAYKFIFELAWREYFQRVWEQNGDNIFTDLKYPQTEVLHHKMPTAVMNANTGIVAVDNAIEDLYATGYMHNHARMYVASIVCNVGKAYWKTPAHWMYYYLLDGDPASNMLSWQWVAGAFSNKKYWCNQENINKYCDTQQQGTFLDRSYEQLAIATQPQVLKQLQEPNLPVIVPQCPPLQINTDKPILLYHHFSLDTQWRSYMDANRILLIEPSLFKQLPVSEKVMNFYLVIAANIQEIQVFVGDFSELKALYPNAKIFYKAHPAVKHWEGIADEPEYLFPQVKKTTGSFMNYWKQCERYL